MRLAIVADIHGNADAFAEVLTDIDGSDVDIIVSLGDNIGYGPESEQVIRMLTERGIESVRGNHEAVIHIPLYKKWFNPHVRDSLQMTIESLSPKSLKAIGRMPPFLVRENGRFVHGFPPKSAFTYLFQADDDRIRRAFSRIPEKICFVGHTHDLLLVEYDGTRRIDYRPLERGLSQLDSGKRYLVNAGSVGQPRDGDSRAKYVIWDTDSETLDLRYINYDVETVVQKIIRAGYPESFGARLR
jgi:predicted phosphodiesterase